MNELIEKLQGHTYHLVGCYLGLKEKYAFLEPMLFDEAVVNKYGGDRKARGFNAVMYSLFYSCIQDIAKITVDKDEKTPSIYNIIGKLHHQPKVREIFRDQFTKNNSPVKENEDEFVKKSNERLMARKEKGREREFDSLYTEIFPKWDSFLNNHPIDAFKTVRDKVTAHLELKKVDGVYKYTDISELGLEWSSPGEAIKNIEKIVLDLDLIIRNTSSFDKEDNKYLKQAQVEFWAV